MNVFAFLRRIAPACALMLCLAGCFEAKTPVAPSEIPPGNETRAPLPAYENPRGLSAWVVYWDKETAYEELALYGDTLEAVCYFEAYFSQSGAPVLPKELVELRRREPENAAWTSYLTFVNDVRRPDGSFSNKDTDFLKTVFGNESAMDAHAEALCALAKDNGFEGLELDYEAIKKDGALWERLAAFTARLAERARREGLKLRVVLEPSAPFELFSQISGPNYVVMCYNLYGTHSGPGPKATLAFIADVVTRAARQLPGQIDFALAAGGFDWGGGKAEAVTERGALSLLASFGSDEVRRDAESGCVVFTYKGADKKAREVWYADGETLAMWAYAVRTAGNYGVSLWRVGGNTDESCLARAYDTN